MLIKNRNTRIFTIIYIVLVCFTIYTIFKNQNANNNNANKEDAAIDSESSETITETLLYEGNDVKIYAKSLKSNVLKLYIENNSNLNLGFNAHSFAVNGIMTKESIYYMDCDVSANAKAYTELEIKNMFLSQHGIKNIERIDILFWAYDNDKYFKEFETPVITVKTSAYKGDSKKISGLEIYNDNNIAVDFINRSNNNFTFCLTNKSNNYFDFSVSNINVNNYTVTKTDYDLYDEQVLNNCQFIFTIKVDESFLELNQIEEIFDISFSFEIEPIGDYSERWTTKKITYQLSSKK